MSMKDTTKQVCSSRDIFSFMVTPDRIPQFFIPSLDIQESQRFLSREKALAWRSHRWHSYDESQKDCRSQRSWSDSMGKQGCGSRGSFSCFSCMEDIPDPVMRAALSLPHLAKVTTPYGFITLGESPKVLNKESLFFQLDLAPPKYPGMSGFSIHCRDTMFCRDRGSQNTLSDLTLETEGVIKNPKQSIMTKKVDHAKSGNSQKAKQISSNAATLLLPRRCSSPTELTCLLETLEKGKSTCQIAGYQRSNSFHAGKPSANLFQTILKKHFSHLKILKSGNLPSATQPGVDDRLKN